MPTVSGNLRYDNNRTTTYSATFPGIANVPIVLQDLDSGVALGVLTDANGVYQFINVPSGDYQIVEQYGFASAVASPADFVNAQILPIINGGIVPPLSYVTATVPPGATNLDCTAPNTLLRTVATTNILNINFLNGPVKYTPITTIMDSHVIISPINLLEEAEYGTFGSFPAGTAARTFAQTNPYPGVGTGFTFTNSVPRDGYFAIQNITSRTASGLSWWSFADHTKGNEMGRIMVVNGYNPGALLYEETVSIKPNTYYLFSAWILNMIKVAGYVDPGIGVQILDSSGRIIVDRTLGQLIPMNPNEPEWVQIGSVIYSDTNTSLTVKFVSQAPDSLGNDYAIDDIMLSEVTMPDLKAEKLSNKSCAMIGDKIDYTISFTNIFDYTIENLVFKDIVPNGLTFVVGSVAIDGIISPGANPNNGFAIWNLRSGDSMTITFSAIVTSIPAPNPAINTATLSYDYSPVEGGVPVHHSTTTNEVPVFVPGEDFQLKKTSSCSWTIKGGTIIYCTEITNPYDMEVENSLFRDILDTNLTYLDGSFTVNGVPQTPVYENNKLEYLIPLITERQTITICFKVMIKTN